MTAEDLFVDYGGNGEAVEAISECFPQLHIVTALAFIIKSYRDKDRNSVSMSMNSKAKKNQFPIGKKAK